MKWVKSQTDPCCCVASLGRQPIAAAADLAPLLRRHMRTSGRTQERRSRPRNSTSWAFRVHFSKSPRHTLNPQNALHRTDTSGCGTFSISE